MSRYGLPEEVVRDFIAGVAADNKQSIGEVAGKILTEDS